MDLSRIFPQPRAVILGGREFTVSQLRLRDLAVLQAWVKCRVPSPLDLHRAEILAHGPGWRKLRAATYEACESWPPRQDSDEALEMLATAEGISFFLLLALSRHHPTLTGESAAELAGAVTVGEYRALKRAVWDEDPLGELEAMIDPEGDSGGEPINWAKFAARCAEDFGWSFEEIGNLTIGQYLAIQTRGELRKSYAVAPGADLAAEAARRRKLFYGDEDEGELPDG